MKKATIIASLFTVAFFAYIIGYHIARNTVDGDVVIYAEKGLKPASVLEDGKMHPIDINTASPDELCSLPGISLKTATYIVEYRVKYGKFRTVKDLLNIPGFTESELKDIAHLITAGG